MVKLAIVHIRDTPLDLPVYITYIHDLILQCIKKITITHLRSLYTYTLYIVRRELECKAVRKVVEFTPFRPYVFMYLFIY